MYSIHLFLDLFPFFSKAFFNKTPMDNCKNFNFEEGDMVPMALFLEPL